MPNRSFCIYCQGSVDTDQDYTVVDDDGNLFCSDDCANCFADREDRRQIASENPEGTLPYNHRIRPLYLGGRPSTLPEFADRAFQYAIEIEMLNPKQDDGAISSNSLLIKAMDLGHIVAKADGSTVPRGGMGFELCSVYAPLQMHYAFGWDKILDPLVKRGWRAWTANLHDARQGGQCSCGIHVSVPTPQSSSTIFWMQKMVYDNPRLMSLICRRDDETANRYASLSRPSAESIINIAKQKQATMTQKYQAINVSSGRVELRRFRGTLNYQSIIAYIEATDALYRYSMTLSAQNAHMCTLSGFVSWVRKQQYKYIDRLLKPIATEGER